MTDAEQIAQLKAEIVELRELLAAIDIDTYYGGQVAMDYELSVRIADAQAENERAPGSAGRG